MLVRDEHNELCIASMKFAVKFIPVPSPVCCVVLGTEWYSIMSGSSEGQHSLGSRLRQLLAKKEKEFTELTQSTVEELERQVWSIYLSFHLAAILKTPRCLDSTLPVLSVTWKI